MPSEGTQHILQSILPSLSHSPHRSFPNLLRRLTFLPLHALQTSRPYPGFKIFVTSFWKLMKSICNFRTTPVPVHSGHLCLSYSLSNSANRTLKSPQSANSCNSSSPPMYCPSIYTAGNFPASDSPDLSPRRARKSSCSCYFNLNLEEFNTRKQKPFEPLIEKVRLLVNNFPCALRN